MPLTSCAPSGFTASSGSPFKLRSNAFRGHQPVTSPLSSRAKATRGPRVAHPYLVSRRCIALAAGNNGDPVVQITVNDAAKKLKEDWTYLDVRTIEEYSQQRVPGSIHVPVLVMGANGMEPNPNFVAEVTKVVPAGEGKRLLVGCRSGMRSQTAIRLLHEDAGPSAYEMLNIDTGIIGWVEAALPLE